MILRNSRENLVEEDGQYGSESPKSGVEGDSEEHGVEGNQVWGFKLT